MIAACPPAEDTASAPGSTIALRRLPARRQLPAADDPPASMTTLATLAGTVRRPRIGVDFHAFDGAFQGSRSHLLGVYGEAIQRAPEFDFVFLCAEPERLRAAHPAFGASNAQCVPLPAKGGFARLGWQLAIAQRRYRLDLLHVQHRMPFIPLGRCAVTMHDALFETHPQFFPKRVVRLARAAGLLAVMRASLLLTVSDFSRREIARLYGVDPGAVVVTGNGVDTARFHPAADDGGEAWNGADRVRARGLEPGGYIASVGRLEPRKNHLNLVRAWALLPEPRLPLVLVGQRDLEQDEVFAEVAARGLQDGVKFLEQVGDDELPALLRHARVFAYPSFAEGFGMPVLEAMASGVPVVASDVAALAELAGGAALLADPDEPQAIADAIERLLHDDELRRRLVAQGLAVAARHRWDDAARALLAAFKRHFAAHPLRG
jgi:glycosyltransferase involved in cell wall biosynthesis